MGITITSPGNAITILDSGVVITDQSPTTITPASSPGITTETPADTIIQVGGVGGTSATDLTVRRIFQLERMWLLALTTGYRELIYSSGDLVTVSVWDTASKGLALFVRTLTYVSGDLATVTTVDQQTADTLTATLAYVSGDLFSVTKAIT